MVQVLPAVPSFGEKLAGALENAGVKIALGFDKRKKIMISTCHKITLWLN